MGCSRRGLEAPRHLGRAGGRARKVALVGRRTGVVVGGVSGHPGRPLRRRSTGASPEQPRNHEAGRAPRRVRLGASGRNDAVPRDRSTRGRGGGRSLAHAPTEYSRTRSTDRVSRRWQSTTSASACAPRARSMRSRRSPTRPIPPHGGLLSNPGDSTRQVRVVRTERRPATHDLRARRGRAGRWPESFESRSGWRADSRSYHGGRRPGRAPPRGREPTYRVASRKRAPSPTPLAAHRPGCNRSPAVRSGGAADALPAPRPDVKAFLAMRLTGVLDRLFGLSAICAPNSAISASNSAISPSQPKATIRRFCRDFATYFGAETRKRNSALRHPHLETPSIDQTASFAGISLDLLRSSGPFQPVTRVPGNRSRSVLMMVGAP